MKEPPGTSLTSSPTGDTGEDALNREGSTWDTESAGTWTLASQPLEPHVRNQLVVEATSGAGSQQPEQGQQRTQEETGGK